MEQNVNLIEFHNDRLIENIEFMNDFMQSKNMQWTFIVKAFNQYPNSFISQLKSIPCKSVGSDNLSHILLLKSLNPAFETWYLNYEGIPLTEPTVDVNLTHVINSSSEKNCLMLQLDPLRYGLPYNNKLSSKYFGAYLDCSSFPNADFFEVWKSFNLPPDTIQSLGTSVSLEQIDYLASFGVNHYRIGESVLTGKTLINQPINGLRQDVFTGKKNITYHSISHIYQ
jgi:hypothetical protein